ncbi:MAG TPA: winged helix-turn-helix domain-containing protein [Terriglobales bacterium]|nr:winged helix-turn-helix domain-containing protein [Terriglobales bacterium]
MRAALRHTSRTADVRLVSFDDISIDFKKMEVQRDGKVVVLTAQEFKTLQFLVQNADRVISRDELLNDVWGYQNYPSTRTVAQKYFERSLTEEDSSHWWMSVVVITLNTPYYAISSRRGDISIGDVVPGRYHMHVFHPSVAMDALHAAEREITVTPGGTFVGTFSLAESDLELAHKNKYGRDYDRPDPDSPAYARP